METMTRVILGYDGDYVKLVTENRSTACTLVEQNYIRSTQLGWGRTATLWVGAA